MGSSSKSKNKGGDIIVQGSILAAAQIIVRLIGLFYRIPLQRIAGDVAMGYYGYAYDIYMLLMLVSSNGVPLAVSKLGVKDACQRDYTNEHRPWSVPLCDTKLWICDRPWYIYLCETDYKCCIWP